MSITASRRPARVEIEASSRKMDRGLREARRKIRAFHQDEMRAKASAAREIAKREKAEAKRSNAMRSGIGAVAGAGAAVLGIGALGNVAADVFDLEKATTRFQMTTDMTAVQTAEFRKELHRLSADTGIARSKLLEGAASYVAMTGDAKGATQAMEIFSETASGSAASMEDIAGAVAVMRDGMGIKEVGELRAGLSALYVQGKIGSVELRDMAQYAADLAPSWRQFEGGTGLEGLRRMGATLQAISSGGIGAAKGSTIMIQMADALARNATKFRKVGVQVFNPKTGKMREFAKIFDDLAKQNLDQETLTKILGSTEAKRGFDQWVKYGSTVDDIIDKSRDVNALSKAATQYQESSVGRIEKAWNAAKLSVAETFTPERVENFAKVIGAAATALGWVMDRAAGALSIAEKAGRGAANIIYGDDYQDKANAEFNRKHAERAAFLQKSKGLSKEAAAAQVVKEDAAVQGLRKGDFDWRDQGWFNEQRGRINTNAWSNKEDMLRTLDVVEKRSAARRAAENGLIGQVLKEALRGITLNATMASLQVKVGADPVAKASANAPAHRTRTGGV